MRPLIRHGTEASIVAATSDVLNDLEIALATDTGKLFIPYNGVKYFIGTGYKKYHYERSECWYQGGSGSATLRRTLYSPNEIEIKIDTVSLKLAVQTILDLNTAGSWDTVSGTDYTTAANRAGKDFYIYMCQPVSGTVPVIKISANSTVPSGYSASTSRKVGGFHCLCVAVGTISNHTLTGYLAGDILPLSVWELWHRAESGNEGMVYASGISAWVDIYLISGTGASTASVNGATISDTRTQYDFVDDTALVNKRLLFDHEFTYIATGSNEATNIDYELLTLDVAPGTAWVAGDTLTGQTSTKTCVIVTVLTSLTYTVKSRTGAFTLGEVITNGTYTADQGAAKPTFAYADPITTGGHMNSVAGVSTRRMISNIGCEDCAGTIWQWLNDSLASVQGADYATGVAFGWKDVTGTRGQVNSQGTYGFYKLIASGGWNYGAKCGSRARILSTWAWFANADIGSRALSNKRC
jgi:hypothetical protein